MASRERPAYPTFPASCWWPLRERFKRALPPAITAEYLQAVLEVEPKTARNLLPMLRQMKLVDEAGAPTGRGNEWRVDAEYRQICHAIRDEIYPAALRHAVPDPSADFDAAVRWFMKASGVGTAAAKRMARFYALLSSADPAEGRRRGERASERLPVRSSERPADGGPRRGVTPARPGRNGIHEPHQGVNGHIADASPERSSTKPDRPPEGAEAQIEGPSEGISLRPIDLPASDGAAVQLVVQIHLPSGATLEQIDALVASIARHLAPLVATPGRRSRH